MEFKIGDTVSVIHETIDGTVTQLFHGMVQILDEDGFSRTYKSDEIVVKASSEKYNLKDISMKEESFSKIKGVIKDDKSNLRKNEIDLHIEELVDYQGDMTNHEILMKQMGVCKQFVQRAIDSNTKRIVLIHGKGEGVLKTEIHTYLNKLSIYHEIRIEYHDAAYTEYGMGGATEVLLG